MKDEFCLEDHAYSSGNGDTSASKLTQGHAVYSLPFLRAVYPSNLHNLSRHHPLLSVDQPSSLDVKREFISETVVLL